MVERVVARGIVVGLASGILLVACGTAPQETQTKSLPEDVAAIVNEPSEPATPRMVPTVAIGTATDALSGPTRYGRALTYYRNGDAEGALREAEKIVQEFPRFAEAWYLKAMCHRSMGEPDKALVSLQKLVEIEPKHEEGLYAMGETLAEMKRYDDAAGILFQVVELKPTPRNIEKYAKVLMAGGDAPTAQKLLESYVKERPDDDELRKLLAGSLLEQKKPKEAQEHYQKIIAHDPKDADAHYRYGVSLQQDGKLDDAVTMFRKAAELDGKNADAYLGLGVACIEQKDLRGAITALEKYLELRPDAEQASKIRDQIALLREQEQKSSS